MKFLEDMQALGKTTLGAEELAKLKELTPQLHAAITSNLSTPLPGDEPEGG